MYGNFLARMGQGFPGQPGMGAMPPKMGGVPQAPVNPPKSYMPQWQGMGQRRADFGAHFGADRGRNALLQMFQNRFRPQQPQQPNGLTPYGIAPGRDIY